MLKRKVRFTFDAMDTVFEGVTDGSRWNGFINVWVTLETHRGVIANMDTPEDRGYFEELEPGPDGLFSYAYGFATHEADAPDVHLDERIFSVDDGHPTTWAEFAVANAEDEEGLLLVRNLQPGEVLMWPGGAGGTSKIVRLA